MNCSQVKWWRRIIALFLSCGTPVPLLTEFPRSTQTKSGALIYGNVLRTLELSHRARGVIFRPRTWLCTCVFKTERPRQIIRGVDGGSIQGLCLRQVLTHTNRKPQPFPFACLYVNIKKQIYLPLTNILSIFINIMGEKNLKL